MKENFKLNSLNAKFANASAEEIVQWALTEIGYKNFILASSMSVEGQVLADILLKLDKRSRILMLDTGRLNEETYDVLDWTRKHYSVSVEIVFPSSDEVEQMVAERGINLFYESVENRKLCCEIRKVRPLIRKLNGLSAWMTGLKKTDSELRTSLEKFQWDQNFGLLKINPLANWTDNDVWRYIRENGIKPNALYEKGYKSIGCAPCTRAVAPGENARSGRWWWEPRCHSECGLHIVNGKLTRKN